MILRFGVDESFRMKYHKGVSNDHFLFGGSANFPLFISLA